MRRHRVASYAYSRSWSYLIVVPISGEINRFCFDAQRNEFRFKDSRRRIKTGSEDLGDRRSQESKKSSTVEPSCLSIPY